MYDPALGRWYVPDPMAEWNFSQSPYNYVLNSPLNYIDPYGLRELTPEQIERRARRSAKRSARRQKRFNRKNGNTTNGGQIEEVVCTGTRTQSKSAAREQASNDSRTWGVFLYGPGGINGTNTIARGIWIDFSILEGLGIWLSQLRRPIEINRPDKQDIANLSVEVAAEVSRSDKEILDESTGSSDAANPENKAIVKVFYENGKYKNWTAVERGHGLVVFYPPKRDSTVIDSAILIKANGKKTLFTPNAMGDGRDMQSLNN